MRWLDSGPVKFLGIVGSLCSIGCAVGGGFAGLEVRGDQWGTAFAATVGALTGAAIAAVVFAVLILVVLRFGRPCPVCQGRGVVASGYTEIMERAHSLCPRCHGDGLIF
jgi:hypothetical protein